RSASGWSPRWKMLKGPHRTLPTLRMLTRSRRLGPRSMTRWSAKHPRTWRTSLKL
ncbi:unnamed protein product, partial [Symbiodinium pilosum]